LKKKNKDREEFRGKNGGIGIKRGKREEKRKKGRKEEKGKKEERKGKKRRVWYIKERKYPHFASSLLI